MIRKRKKDKTLQITKWVEVDEVAYEVYRIGDRYINDNVEFLRLGILWSHSKTFFDIRRAINLKDLEGVLWGIVDEKKWLTTLLTYNLKVKRAFYYPLNITAEIIEIK